MTTHLKRYFLFSILISGFIFTAQAQQYTGYASFNKDWTFVKDIDTTGAINTLSNPDNHIRWEAISLPHTPRIEPVEKKEEQWQGTCYYRKIFTVPALAKGKHIAVQFDAAMHEADIFLNGKQIARHVGGYLPFYIDLTNKLNYAGNNVILVKLNNQDNPLIPPGKPIKDLDFNIYGGIYRNAWLITLDKLHFTDAVYAGKEAGGGVLLNYENVSARSAVLAVKTEIKNEYSETKNAQVRLRLLSKSGAVVSSVVVAVTVKPGESIEVSRKLVIASPQLWTPENPYLYTLSAEILNGTLITGQVKVRTGVRSIKFTAGAFFLNGEKVNLRGTNRHQEYPLIGYALSDNAQYRDAWKIKNAGFNFVRSSHYPHSSAFLDACDELGVLVMDAIPGWQFVGKEEFEKNSFQDIRDMVRRDRNHPSIIAWEASLNESRMTNTYMDKAHAIVHRELPFPDVYTSGWTDYAFDIFIPARQHGKAPDYWKKYAKDKPLLIAEYGDWEYYAQNAGFNQTAYADLKQDERTSRQLRSDGQKRLLQQALNYQEAHNDNLYGPAVGDANWLIFDYKRGYAPDIESSGIMDIFRLPKPAFYFYKSQAGPFMASTTTFGKPMISIANYWNDASFKTVKVYSNCEEVELLLNGKSLGKQLPDKDQYSTNLKHPPFTFTPAAYEEGTLTAIGYIGGKKVTQAIQGTPGKADRVVLTVDYSGKTLKAGVNDVVFVHASVTDAQGNLIPGATDKVDFSLSGDAEIVGPQSLKAEAGIASIVLKAGNRPSSITINAKVVGLPGASLVLYSK